LSLTPKGENLLVRALPAWLQTHDEVEELIPGGDPGALRRSLHAFS